MKVSCSSVLFLLAAILITAGCTHNKTIEGFSAINWSEIGRQAIDANRWNEALNAYNKAIELNPNDASAYYYHGNAYSRLGNSTYANEDWKIAAKLGNMFAQKSLKEKGITW
jgi:Flp pilus assembly protein TadD